jgi:hypothetical protein
MQIAYVTSQAAIMKSRNSGSMKSSLSALSGPRVRIRDVPRVRSGSRAKFLLRADRIRLKGAQAALALAKRRLPLRAAHGVVTRLYDRGLALVELPAVENARKVIRELAGAGVTATLRHIEENQDGALHRRGGDQSRR